MLKIENTEVFGWEAAIRGMRNPKNSHDKSDSECLHHMFQNYSEDDLRAKEYTRYLDEFNLNLKIGSNDLQLAKTLANAGTDHGKFLRMIHVQVDVTAPLYWWKEADQYKVGTVTDSCSTMHKIHAKGFTLDDFSHEHLNRAGIDLLTNVIRALNEWRAYYCYGFDSGEYKIDKGDKDQWWQMIQLLPSSYNQRRTWDLNYAVLKNIYHARKNHKLDEWHELCAWIETLPYAKELIIGE